MGTQITAEGNGRHGSGWCERGSFSTKRGVKRDKKKVCKKGIHFKKVKKGKKKIDTSLHGDIGS